MTSPSYPDNATEGHFEKKDFSRNSVSTYQQAVFNRSSPNAVYMHQWTGSSLAQVMACRLFSAKPLPEPVLAYCQYCRMLHGTYQYWSQCIDYDYTAYMDCISVKFELEFYHFHSRKCTWKCCLPKWQPFCPGRDELKGAVCGGTLLCLSQQASTLNISPNGHAP